MVEFPSESLSRPVKSIKCPNDTFRSLPSKCFKRETSVFCVFFHDSVCCCGKVFLCFFPSKCVGFFFSFSCWLKLHFTILNANFVFPGTYLINLLETEFPHKLVRLIRGQ